MADWQPSAEPAQLQLRAAALAAARQFFAEREVLEVETPLLGANSVTDVHIDSVPAQVRNEQFWLRTSPEYHMKRLLAAWPQDIYQVAKVFRDGEYGRLHQPEFTMIEWYRIGFDLRQLIDECCDLITCLYTLADNQIPSRQQVSYQEAFMQTCGIDPLQASLEELQATAAAQIDAPIRLESSDHRNDWLDLLAGSCVYPQLGTEGLLVVHDYPADQAMLARLNPNDRLLAERFEIFLNGVELANGYRELTDAGEQAGRFAADNLNRVERGKVPVAVDPNLLAALQAGMPDCSGVAVGLDRLLMLTAGLPEIASTLSFAPGR